MRRVRAPGLQNEKRSDAGSQEERNVKGSSLPGRPFFWKAKDGGVFSGGLELRRRGLELERDPDRVQRLRPLERDVRQERHLEADVLLVDEL
jgi:hypothetical protein